MFCNGDFFEIKYIEIIFILLQFRLKKGIRIDNTFRSNFVKVEIALAILP